MSLHTAQPTTPASQLATELLKSAAAHRRPARHRRTLARIVLDMARASEWHAMWCLLGDILDNVAYVVIAWAAVVSGVIVVAAVGVTVGYVGGPVAALAYILALMVAVLVWFRWDGGQR